MRSLSGQKSHLMRHWLGVDLKNYLDRVALATVADMVPLQGEPDLCTAWFKAYEADKLHRASCVAYCHGHINPH